MARKTKSSSTKSTGANASADGKDDETPKDDTPKSESTVTGDGSNASPEASSEPDGITEPETSEEQVPNQETADADAPETPEDTETSEGSEPADTDPGEDLPMSNAPVPTEQVVIHKGGFVPLLIGGLLAGAIGFAAGHFGFGGAPDNSAELESFKMSTEAALSEQAAAIANLSENSAAPDLTELTDRLSSLEGKVDAISETVTTLESRPATGTGVTGDVSEELDAMRAELDELLTKADAVEASAKAEAQATMQRAAVVRLRTAIEAGGGFADSVADLETAGVQVPAALSGVADEGVPSLAELQASFPDAARAALAASRDAAAREGEDGGTSAFLRNLLGVRSLEPREGNDPDAVLSRAEAAVREARLTDALAEIETLPEIGRQELSDWAGRAARRLEAVTAVQQLSEDLN